MSLSSPHLAQLTKTAKYAAVQAGEYIQSQFNSAFVTQSKVGGDTLASQVVTEVDIKAQEIILTHLSPSIQAHDLGLLTEEATDDRSRLEKDYFWCIDPLDGTLPFTERRSGYAVSIALVSKAGDPIIGVVYVPDLQVCYTAHAGSGTYRNDERLFRKKPSEEEILHFYMDQSFLETPYFSWVKANLEEWIKGSEYQKVEYHSTFGGVCNALGVLESDVGCYFKFPKEANGCGSIWDYAATYLLMQESGLPVFNAQGSELHLNDPETTFMNRQGILYATDEPLVAFITELAKEWASRS